MANKLRLINPLSHEEVYNLDDINVNDYHYLHEKLLDTTLKHLAIHSTDTEAIQLNSAIEATNTLLSSLITYKLTSSIPINDINFSKAKEIIFKKYAQSIIALENSLKELKWNKQNKHLNYY